MDIENLKNELKEKANSEKAETYKNFFKTGKGEYGEGDIFLGLTSKEVQDIAKKYNELNFDSLQKLLADKIHEFRMVALRILNLQYKKNKKNVFDFYLKNTKNINNWDLVDVSCYKIVGDFLIGKDKNVLYDLADSKNLWEKRISIVSTYAFIREKDFEDTLKISEVLINDTHDLIHKAVGWMLREVGKRNQEIEEKFLKKHYKKMPRTMLRYAIEKFEEGKRKKYLRGEI